MMYCRKSGARLRVNCANRQIPCSRKIQNQRTNPCSGETTDVTDWLTRCRPAVVRRYVCFVVVGLLESFLLSLFLFRKATPSTHKTILLGSDSHLPNHAHFVMQGADVREDSGVRESDAETCHAKGRLWQSAPFLWRRDDEPRVRTVCR